jgi:hypothetical protein
MAEQNRKPITDRLAALVAGPFLLGRRALDLVWTDAPEAPPGPATEVPARIPVTPPEHAIKRRG